MTDTEANQSTINSGESAISSTTDVQSIVDDYESRLDEVAELIARVRHEINNPLAGVLGQAQLLLREELSEGARKRAETIEELAIRLRDVVAQLRQIQKPAKPAGPDNP